MRLTLTLPLLLSCVGALPAQWTETSPLISPTLRRAGAMAYDAIGNRMLIYGGTSPSPSTILAETWGYSGVGWSQLLATAPGRWGHQMARNTVSNRILTFGGRSPTIGGLSNDTMEWTGAAWATVPTPTAPSPRFLYGLCFDSLREVYVMFGGRTSAGTIAETWEFNGVSWTQINPATVPPAREEMMLVYDTSINRVVMFGGCDDNTDTIRGDTWTYDGNNWTQVLDELCAGCPTPRVRMASAFDSVRKRAVLYGGYAEAANGQRAISDETWEFTGDAWTLIPAAVSPPNATETYHAFNPLTGKFVLFGGFGGSFSNDTWEYTGSTTGLFALYGEGCDTSVGEPTFTATTPEIGTALTFTWGNLPSEGDIVLVALGLSNTNWMGIPLPFDLGIIGLSGCNLLASADVLEVALAIGGEAMFTVLIPNQTNLINASIYGQGIVADLDPFLFLGASRGGRALLGN